MHSLSSQFDVEVIYHCSAYYISFLKNTQILPSDLLTYYKNTRGTILLHAKVPLGTKPFPSHPANSRLSLKLSTGNLKQFEISNKQNKYLHFWYILENQRQEIL